MTVRPKDIEMPRALRNLRVAIVHDYLNQQGGAEKVVQIFATMFPDAPVYVSVYDRQTMPSFWRGRDVRTTFLQHLSPDVRWARTFLPLYPTAFERFDFSQYDLVLSSTTAFAKGIITRPHTFHACYCNNPARFLWSYADYVQYEQIPTLARLALPWVITPLRVYDYAAAQRVDRFIAGSYNAARRISKYYRRDSVVLQPPIDAARFRQVQQPDDFFLVVSRLQAYKRVDLAVAACTRLNLPLHVVGSGPDEARLKRLAGPSVRFLGRLPDEQVLDQFARCQAFLFPGEEDFGLTPLEAQASGRPVIAYGAGGALETVREGSTGLFFGEPTVDSLVHVLKGFEPDAFDPAVMVAQARRFDQVAFMRNMYVILACEYERYQAGQARPEAPA